jgi:glycosyltransferase involved in cell wall biosynthesis
VQQRSVSIIIPVLNAERYIAQCLHALRSLERSEYGCEIVIVDNGSTDRTPDIIREFRIDPHVIPDVHVGGLRNRGVAFSSGEFLAFVDADVEVAPVWLLQGLKAFSDPSVVATGCFPDIPRDSTWVQRAWDIHQRRQYGDEDAIPIAWLPSMNLMVRRDAFLAIGGFNEQLETAEDVDLCYRLGQHGTILRNPDMAAVHWGEAGDLKTYWRKEVWRGAGNLYGVLSHGMRWDELPSLAYPLYMIGAMLLLLAGIVVDVSQHQVRVVLLAVAALLLPATLLAIRTGWRARIVSAVPALMLLYLTYGLARSYAMVTGIIGRRRVRDPVIREGCSIK